MPNLLLLGLAAVLVGCARAGPLPIDESRYSRNYVLQLRRGAVLFRAWHKEQEGSDGSDPYQWDGEPLDLALERFICKAKESGIPYYLAIHAVLFAQVTRPRLKRQLTAAWDRITAWQLQRPVRLRLPLPRPICEALFLVALDLGFVRQPARAWLWLPFAIVLRLGFGALLRPGEFLGALRGHVTLPSQTLFGFGQRVVIAIMDPKNRRAGGRFQFATAEDAVTVAWAEWLLAGLPKGWKIFPGGAPTFAKLFREALAQLDLGSAGFTPASLRAGGATAMFMDEVPVETLRFRGRWTNTKTLEHYIQEGMACLQMSQLSGSAALRVSKYTGAFASGPWPPSDGWQRFFSRERQRLGSLPKALF